MPRRGNFPWLAWLWQPLTPLASVNTAELQLCRKSTPSATRSSDLGDRTLSQKEATFDWPHRDGPHPDALWHFHREFTPLDSTQLLVSPVSLPYRGNITCFDGVLGWLFVVCFVVLFGVVVCFGLLVWLCFWCLTSSSCSVSLPSMMTWAHRPHGVRTRGKKRQHLSDV